METLYKKDFVDVVYKKLKEEGHYVKKETVQWTNKAFIECMLDVLRNGEKLSIYNTFILYQQYIKKRNCYNFGKGTVEKPGHYKPCLKPLQRMKDACDEYGEGQEDE